jgi:radical SAM superfamily enzyme YgiQ (UPF0313 family)
MQKHEIYYCPPVFRPPSEAHSLLIQLTEGCTYECDFCIPYLKKSFNVRDIAEVKKDLDVAKDIYGPGVRRIFFLDGNAMVTPTEKLLEITNFAYETFPNLERISVYAHSKDILKKSEEQLKQLSDSGLNLAYVGFESGYDELLKTVNKHATKKDHIEASKKLMEANITLSATLINGLGGNNTELSEKHAIESADLINKICPDDDRIWYVAFLTLMIPPGTVIFKKRSQDLFQEMNSTEILKELKMFIQNIEFHNNKAECIFRCNHASNYLPIKGILDREKESILSTINYGLTHSEILKPEFYRGL